MQSLKHLLDADHFTDLTIICSEKKFKCHKVIVCAQSEYMKRACLGGFQVCMLRSNGEPFVFSTTSIELNIHSALFLS